MIGFTIGCYIFCHIVANGPASMWGLGLCDSLKRPCMLAIVELNLR
jgi:hypothetical protein